MRSFFLTLAACAALFAIVPLMVWGGTGSVRHALHALKVYLQIIGGIALLGGGLGLVLAFAEHGWAMFG
jgi:hypothetical protein